MQFPRALERRVIEYLDYARVVAILGARQVGKTTLTRMLPGNREYFTLDDLATRDAATRDPVGFVRALPSGSIIDEVQIVPEVTRAIKTVVDTDRTPGRFVVTGSSNILTNPALSESLAGRMSAITLQPLSGAEIACEATSLVDSIFASDYPWRPQAIDQNDLITRVLVGGYPPAVLAPNARAREIWFTSYLQAMMQRDIRELAKIDDVAAMYRLLGELITRTGQIRNMSKTASTTGINAKTIERYMATLEQAYLITVLPAYRPTISGRKSAAPKVYANDSGMAAAVLNVDLGRIGTDRSIFGALFETFVINEFLKHASWSDLQVTPLHYRERNDIEVDLLLEARDGRAVAIGIKATQSPTSVDFRGLERALADDRLNVVHAVLIYTGSQVIRRRQRLSALPASILW